MSEKEKVQQMYEEKKRRVVTTCNLREPDRVPILSQVNAFAIGYCGHTASEIFDNPLIERECYSKALTDFYCDTVMGFGMNYPYKSFIEVGSDTYFVSDNGYTIQHRESSNMNSEEYEELLQNPIAYIANKIAHRKISGLREAYPKNYKNIEKLFDAMDQHKRKSAANKKFVKEELGLPLMAKGSAAHPLDNFFDFIRGFKGTLADMRRRPEEVLKAIDVLTPFFESTIPDKANEEFPYIRNTAHIPTFLSPEMFKKFYWPYLKSAILKAHQAGTKYIIFCEGTWEQHFPLFEELPQGSVIAVLESDDVIKIKKRYGSLMTIAGGYTQGLLRYGTKQDCIDCAKRVIDACAPGGGFIFTGDKTFLTVEDINIDNYKAITEFAHEYGKY
ncbi:MAG: uroporphyrinogen decarboxylase family protein [Eubacteriales bacterium]